jgi:hypothetical protein
MLLNRTSELLEREKERAKKASMRAIQEENLRKSIEDQNR